MWRAGGMKQTSEITFAPDWLALREPADLAARDKGLLTRAAASMLANRPVLDLGGGTGSTARAFADAGYHDLTWRFFDNDPDLLALALHHHPSAQAITGDLSDVARIPLEGAGLVTASALLDLMSANWVDALAKRLRAAHVPFYAALNYDGVMRWTPPLGEDTAVTRLFNAHQQQDKGTGVALGPVSGQDALRIFERNGFEVMLAQSPWTIGPDQASLHEHLAEGIASAVSELDHSLGEAWLGLRKAALGTSRAFIGHTDLLAIPRPRTT